VDFFTTFAKILWSTLFDVLPIVVVLVGFQFGVVRRALRHPRQITIGLVYVLLGLTLFLVGLNLALFPLGENMARQLTAPGFVGAGSVMNLTWRDYYWVYIFGAAIGFSTAIAEPALIAVALKVEEVSGGAVRRLGLRIAVAIGVAIGVALGTFRIVTGTPLHYYIIAGYLIVILQTTRTSRFIIPLAYDSGGVATSTVTVPLVAALGLGLASSIPGRSPIIDGFGLIASACLFPIITVMAYAEISVWRADRSRKKNDQKPSHSGPDERNTP
jgi:hypothetical protein